MNPVGWDITKTYFFWGDGTYTTRREVVEADRVFLILPESKLFGLPRHPESDLREAERD